MMTKLVEINYTNWRGVTADRKVFPISLWFGSTEWHRDPQWLLHAKDIKSGDIRDFAMSSIHSWKNLDEQL